MNLIIGKNSMMAKSMSNLIEGTYISYLELDDINSDNFNKIYLLSFPEKYKALADRLQGGGRVGNSQLSYYKFTTPQTLGNMISRMSETAIKENYSNTLFIIDEVHKIKPYENVKDKKVELAKKQQELSNSTATTFFTGNVLTSGS